MPASAVAHAARRASRSVNPLCTFGRPVMPHSPRNAALDATPVLPASREATSGATCEISLTATHFPARLSRFLAKSSAKTCGALSDLAVENDVESGGGTGALSGRLPRAWRTRAKTDSRPMARLLGFFALGPELPKTLRRQRRNIPDGQKRLHCPAR